MENTDSILINIDSKNRDKEIFKDSSYFIYDFLDPINNVTGIRMASIEFPNVYYLFSCAKDNNWFKITIGGTEYKIEALTGTYTSDSMVNYLQDEIDAIINVIPGRNFKVTFSLITYRLTFTSDVAFSLDFQNTNTNYLPFGFYLGFRSLNYNVNIASGGKYSITAESNLDVLGDNYIFIRINDIGNVYYNIPTFRRINNEYKFFMDKRMYFAKVLVSGMKNDIIFDTGQNFICKCFNYRQPVDLKRFEIELFDSFGQRINMNNFNYSITLEITYIYDSKTKIMFENSLFRSLPSRQTINYTNGVDEYDESNQKIRYDINKSCSPNQLLQNVFSQKSVILDTTMFNNQEQKEKRNNKKLSRKEIIDRHERHRRPVFSFNY